MDAASLTPKREEENADLGCLQHVAYGRIAAVIASHRASKDALWLLAMTIPSDHSSL